METKFQVQTEGALVTCRVITETRLAQNLWLRLYECQLCDWEGLAKGKDSDM
jgi:hypothetical protein